MRHIDDIHTVALLIDEVAAALVLPPALGNETVDMDELVRTVRQNLFAAIDDPSPSHWERVYDIRFPHADRITTLWRAVVEISGFVVLSRTLGSDGTPAPWEVTPSPEMIFLALDEVFSPQRRMNGKSSS
ncbi:hypothetical protein [Lysinibacter cavernae]|uniref:hypothetical protein n=1 Tax=Lysinibacter cavernae TaxID=1640652 RepID=UPI00362246EE